MFFDEVMMLTRDQSILTGEIPGGNRASALHVPHRVAAMISTLGLSGPGRQLVSLASELTKSGCDFKILLLNRGKKSVEQFASFARDHGINCELLRDRSPVDVQLLGEVRQFVASWRPDIMQSHGYKASSIMFVLKCLGVRCPWVGFFEGQTDLNLKDRLYHRLDLLMLRAADRVVVMSDLQRSMFPRHARYVEVVHNAVPHMIGGNATRQLPPILQRKRGAGAAPLVGVVGRLSREKGIDVFIESMARLKSRGVRATAVIIGPKMGEYGSQLEVQVRTLGLSDRIVFTGNLDDMPAVYAALDLLVIPSRSEGLPSTLLEAMQADLPIVSTRVGAIIEITKAFPEALKIVPVENPDLLANGIVEALAELDSSVQAAARARVVGEFSSAKRGRRMLELYSNVMRERDACQASRWRHRA
jgi:glycosyltransferase involved in cell wall biosynthesis